MKIDRLVTVTDKRGVLVKAHLIGVLQNEVAELDLFFTDFNFKNIEGYDFFDSLIKLRTLLEKKELFILCKGAAINVYPSRMAREMSSGLKAYSLELGKKASMDQLVEIFDPASPEEVGLISEQTAFFEKWIQTPKK